MDGGSYITEYNSEEKKKIVGIWATCCTKITDLTMHSIRHAFPTYIRAKDRRTDALHIKFNESVDEFCEIILLIYKIFMIIK